jgi:hypothetical protein
VPEEEAKRPTITLQDGSVVDAEKAVLDWELLESMMRPEREVQDRQEHFVPPKRHELMRSLIALAVGRRGDVDPRHVEELASVLVLDSPIDPATGRIDPLKLTLEPETVTVLRNCVTRVDGALRSGALRFNSAADRVIAEKVRAEVHQGQKEAAARACSPGGWAWPLAPWNKGKGPSIQ